MPTMSERSHKHAHTHISSLSCPPPNLFRISILLDEKWADGIDGRIYDYHQFYHFSFPSYSAVRPWGLIPPTWCWVKLTPSDGLSRDLCALLRWLPLITEAFSASQNQAIHPQSVLAPVFSGGPASPHAKWYIVILGSSSYAYLCSRVTTSQTEVSCRIEGAMAG